MHLDVPCRASLHFGMEAFSLGLVELSLRDGLAMFTEWSFEMFWQIDGCLGRKFAA